MIYSPCRHNVPGLTFEDVPHIYRMNGTIVPGVTTVLRESLGGVYMSPQMEAGMLRGKAVHLATQYLDEGRLNWASIDPVIAPYVKAYTHFLKEKKPLILLIEQLVYHPMGYAGTLDRVVKMSDRIGVLDIKTGSVPNHSGPQLSAYREAVIQGCEIELRREIEISDTRWVLLLKSDETFQLSRCKDESDWDFFKAALFVKRWKERNK